MKALLNKCIVVIGAGNVGRMLLERMRLMGVYANKMVVGDSDPERAEQRPNRWGHVLSI